ncbi:MAG TPA: aldo/keto reductase [Actinomycetota bacterium]|jgi:aryl-alcohol dehydrogenase-like predicted oxidoreductase|nr:aldo/keto reductase [Actinomycetota bacterium]
METRKLGSLDVSVVGLGCNNFGMRIDEAATKEVVDAAIDAGINFFDTADVYGNRGKSEEFLGKALGPKRDDVLIATKFGSPMSDDGQSQGGSPRWIERAVEDSLRRLGTDRIDLYQHHFPDRDTPFDETLAALDKLVRDGKVREIGCSNYAGKHIDKCAGISKDKGIAQWVSAQNNYSLLERAPEADVIGACERNGLGLLPYFPLASGLLTGKYVSKDDRPEGTRITLMAQAMPERAEGVLTDENFAIIGKLRAFAEEHGHSLLDLAMSWLASKPVISSVIAGATKPEQVRANVDAASWRLTPDEMAQVDALSSR